jgi:hypothetical protein
MARLDQFRSAAQKTKYIGGQFRLTELFFFDAKSCIDGF